MVDKIKDWAPFGHIDIWYSLCVDVQIAITYSSFLCKKEVLIFFQIFLQHLILALNIITKCKK